MLTLWFVQFQKDWLDVVTEFKSWLEMCLSIHTLEESFSSDVRLIIWFCDKTRNAVWQKPHIQLTFIKTLLQEGSWFSFAYSM